MKPWAEEVTDLLENTELNQSNLANLCGVSLRTVYRWKTGCSVPGDKKKKRYRKAFKYAQANIKRKKTKSREDQFYPISITKLQSKYRYCKALEQKDLEKTHRILLHIISEVAIYLRTGLDSMVNIELHSSITNTDCKSYISIASPAYMIPLHIHLIDKDPAENLYLQLGIRVPGYGMDVLYVQPLTQKCLDNILKEVEETFSSGLERLDHKAKQSFKKPESPVTREKVKGDQYDV